MASIVLDVRPDSVKDWYTGRRKVPDGVRIELRMMLVEHSVIVSNLLKEWKYDA